MSDVWRLPSRLGDEVTRALGRAGGDDRFADIGVLVQRWPGSVGETIARNAWPARLARDGTLVVHTSSSTCAQELTQLEPAVRAQLGADAPRLRFVVGPLPEPDVASAPNPGRSVHKPCEDERAEAVEIAAAIENDGLREAVARACAMSLAVAREDGTDRLV